MHNMYMAFRKMYEALGIKDIDRILPPPAPNAPKDPSLEHIDSLAGKPFKHSQVRTIELTLQLT